jgi:DNA-binding LacI/PurR family transcriptional regulator
MLCVPGVVNGRYGAALAYESVMQEAGRELEHIFTPLSRHLRRDARHTLAAYVREHGCPDAIFCANDEQAIGAHAALAELGRRVPEDVAIVGCDGIEETEHHVPPISTIGQPIRRDLRRRLGILAEAHRRSAGASPGARDQRPIRLARFFAAVPSTAAQAALLQKKRRQRVG